MLMILSKENVLEFAWIQGSESVSKKNQTLQNIPNVREIIPTSVCLLEEELLFVCEAAKIPEGRE